MIPRYSTVEMTAIWGDVFKLQSMWRVEMAAAAALFARGLIPPASALLLATRPEPDWAGAIPRIREIEKKTGHDVVAFLEFLEETIGPDARFLHRGMTSSDVVDTVLAMQLAEASRLIQGAAAALMTTIERRALEFRGVPCIGRTHGQHAEPTTFGLKMAVWHSHVKRAADSFARGAELCRFGKLSGPVGTYANFPMDAESEVLAGLGLLPEPVSTQIIPRDRHAQYVQALAILATACETIALEVRHLARTEVGEIQEGTSSGYKGSSAMPHKKNPVGCENLCGLSRVVRGHATTALEDIALWHERDISHSSAERIILPDSTTLVHYMLKRLEGIISKMTVFPERMFENMDSTGGLIYSGPLLLKLTGVSSQRKEAYERIQELAWKSGGHRFQCHFGQVASDPLFDISFKELVEKDEFLATVLSKEDISEAFSLKPHLANEGAIFERVFGKGLALKEEVFRAMNPERNGEIPSPESIPTEETEKETLLLSRLAERRLRRSGLDDMTWKLGDPRPGHRNHVGDPKLAVRANLNACERCAVDYLYPEKT